MSVFPRRVGHGDTVVVHANILGRALATTAAYAELHLTVTDPLGAETQLLRRTILSAPWPAVTATDGDVEAAGGVRKELPLVVLASMLAGPADRQRLLDVLSNIQDGTHFYAAYQVPTDGAPGRYVVRVEVRSDGRLVRWIAART